MFNFNSGQGTAEEEHTSHPTATVLPLAAIEEGANFVPSSNTFWLSRIASIPLISAMNTVPSAATARDLGCELVGEEFAL